MKPKTGNVIPLFVNPGTVPNRQPLKLPDPQVKLKAPCVPIPLDHDNQESILTASYSPDGRHLAYGTSLGHVGVWDVSNGYEVGSQSVVDHKLAVSSMRLLEDELILGTRHGEVFVTDAKFARPPQRLWQSKQDISTNPKREVVAISPDGRYSVVSQHRDTIVYDREKNRSLSLMTQIGSGHVFDDHRFYFDLGIGHAYSPAVFGYDLQNGLDISRGKKQFKTFGNAWAMDLSQDGKLLAVGTVNGTVSIWNTETGNLATSALIYQRPAAPSAGGWAQPLMISSLVFLPGNVGLIVGHASGVVELLRINGTSLEPIGSFSPHMPPHLIAISPTQDSILIAAADYGIRLPQNDDESDGTMAQVWSLRAFVNLGQSYGNQT